MNNLNEKQIEVRVQKNDLRHWLNDKTLPLYGVLQKMLHDPEMRPLDKITIREDDYHFSFEREYLVDNQSISLIRTYITDLENVLDFTYLELMTLWEDYLFEGGSAVRIFHSQLLAKPNHINNNAIKNLNGYV